MISDVDAGEGHLMIGADGYGCNSLLDSYIDEIHIYKGIVSSEKVKELYEEVKMMMGIQMNQMEKLC